MQRLIKGQANAVTLGTTGIAFRCDSRAPVRRVDITHAVVVADQEDVFVYVEHGGAVDGGTVPADVAAFPLTTLGVSYEVFCSKEVGFKMYASEAVAVKITPRSA